MCVFKVVVEMIPDMDAEIKKKLLDNQKLNAPAFANQRVADVNELEIESKKNSLPVKGVDITHLTKYIRPYEEVNVGFSF
jgi:hypothetical protein